MFTSFASSSINTLMSEALDLGKKKKKREKILAGKKEFPFLHADNRTVHIKISYTDRGSAGYWNCLTRCLSPWE